MTPTQPGAEEVMVERAAAFLDARGVRLRTELPDVLAAFALSERRDAEEALQIVGLKLAQAEAREKALAGLLGEIRGNTDNEVVRARIDSALAPRAETWVPRAGDVVRYIGPEDNERDEPANHRIVARVEERVGQEPYLHTLNFWTWSKNGSQASWYRYLRPATPSERLAAGLPAPEPAPERPSQVRVLRSGDHDSARPGCVYSVVEWSEGRPVIQNGPSEVCLIPSVFDWEPVSPAPSPARESSVEQRGAPCAPRSTPAEQADVCSRPADQAHAAPSSPLLAFALALAREHTTSSIPAVAQAARALLKAQEV